MRRRAARQHQARQLVADDEVVDAGRLRGGHVRAVEHLGHRGGVRAIRGDVGFARGRTARIDRNRIGEDQHDPRIAIEQGDCRRELMG